MTGLLRSNAKFEMGNAKSQAAPGAGFIPFRICHFEFRIFPMRALDLKLIRDVGKMKGQMVAVGLVMACGLAMMIMARSLILSLETTRAAYYERNHFADVFRVMKSC